MKINNKRLVRRVWTLHNTNHFSSTKSVGKLIIFHFLILFVFSYGFMKAMISNILQNNIILFLSICSIKFLNPTFQFGSLIWGCFGNVYKYAISILSKIKNQPLTRNIHIFLSNRIHFDSSISWGIWNGLKYDL